MADIQFCNESDGQSFQMTQPKAARVVDDVEKWAVKNGFGHITFWRDEGDSSKYWVQLGEDKLNYWVHESTFSEGKHEDVEMQLDYARGAQRRSAAGYAKFDK